MLDQDVSYSIESEIDKAFPYLNKLDEEIVQLKQIADKNKLSKESSKIVQKRKFNFFNFFLVKNKTNLNVINSPKKLRLKTLKHHNFVKDGYEFHIRIVNIYEDKTNITDHYEFTVTISFNEVIKKNQFYKKISNKEEALQYYKDMEGVFKHLTRRDLMERLFKEKLQEIEYYKNQC